ncbi:baseplate megatron protein TIM-barrel domain-containing protein [Candidatus Sneabacter namystus]|uniref:GTA TIM-barrel-like domain-containing protein n=1 Tax=Candidatus Sneabacter namystus TaxID=2601646 RepID=A0A5C0UL52_9RICK|nr:glycoside hydrolase TIM-barrel-like domain-containing protein [Candidatus Sneabacter namystus]QEK39584.1 hypothetical protein FZC37_01370 [Candidatus Sneabacter namystus]
MSKNRKCLAQLEQKFEFSVTSSSDYITHMPFVLGIGLIDGIYLYLDEHVFVIGICEGPVDDIKSFFINHQTIPLDTYKYMLFYDQDVLKESPHLSFEERAHLIKYRNFIRLWVYIVFMRSDFMHLKDGLSTFSFLVQNGSHGHKERIEKIRGINIIPGSGEFVCDTMRVDLRKDYEIEKPVNYSLSDSRTTEVTTYAVENLQYLKNELKRVEWVSVVVCWYGDDMCITKCNIAPRVENSVEDLDGGSYSIEWKVANWDRKTCKKVGVDKDVLRYGGTMNDDSLLRYIIELKKRGYQVMLYPMIMMDVEGKKWRGQVKLISQVDSITDSVNNFFKKQGYFDFIIHYAKMCAEHIDAFIIGSEMVEVTSIRDRVAGKNIFPAVNNLKELAKEVKSIFSARKKEGNVVVTYAADWSEYYHLDRSMHHLDSLWSDENIDVVGIDAYFPLTDCVEGNITYQDIVRGWQCGNQFDYFVDDKGVRHAYKSDKYALKNIEYWWENDHFDEEGVKTSWVPRSKKIWFTEYGFASIDKTTNQPNVFFDISGLCETSNIPQHSKKFVDFAIQEDAIRATLDFWHKRPFVENLFLWCWDMRYPVWPKSTIWKDGANWKLGHWVNGKLSGVCVGDIIAELFLRCGVKNFEIHDDVKMIVPGIVLDYNLSCEQLLDRVSKLYSLTICINEKGVIEVRRLHSIGEDKKVIKGEDLIPIDGELIKTDTTSILGLTGNFALQYYEFPSFSANKIPVKKLRRDVEYKYLHTHGHFDVIFLPFCFDRQKVPYIIEDFIDARQASNAVIQFRVPAFFGIRSGDVVRVVEGDMDILAKVLKCVTSDQVSKISALIVYS